MQLSALTPRPGPPPPHNTPTPARFRALSRRFLGLLALVLAVFGFGVVASRPAAPAEDVPATGGIAAAERTIQALVDPRSGRDPLALLPTDFTKVSGVVPGKAAAPDGTVRAVHVDGGCSAPWGEDNTRWDFSVACKAHDLGYDLLRYAEHKGQPLPARYRRELDSRLEADMYGQCDRNPRGSAGTCRVVAALYTAGLSVNSWHQRWGPPRSEQLGAWAVGLLVVLVLLAVRVFGLPRVRVPRPHPTVTHPELAVHPEPAEPVDTGGTHGPGAALGAVDPAARFMSALRVTSLVAVLLGESLLALLRWGDQDADGLWPITWLLQLTPVLFFAGGHANLLAWREVRLAGGDYGRYLASRISALIRPVLVFVVAWLIVPLSLELLDAPDAAVAAVGRLVVQPLWLFGIFLLVVAACPLMRRLHQRWPVRTPLTLAAAAVGTTHISTAPGYLYLATLLFALFFAQLAFSWDEGRLRRLPRRGLAAVALVALVGLVLATTVGGQPRLLMPDFGESVGLAPSLACLLLLGLAQVGLVCLVREFGPVTTGRPWRLVGALRSAPMTAYLVSLGATMVLVGLAGAVGPDWIARPGTWLAFALLGVSALAAFRWFEHHRWAHPWALGIAHRAGGVHAVAAALGVGYGVLGALGFAVTGPTWQVGSAALFGMSLDPLANLIHLLVGWYLLHAVRAGTSGRPLPWLLAAVACVPPMITSGSGPGYVLHVSTIAVALVASVVCVRTKRMAVRVA